MTIRQADGAEGQEGRKEDRGRARGSRPEMDENERKLSSPSPLSPLIGQNHATKSALVPTFNAFNRDRMAAKASRPNDASLILEHEWSVT